jgi:hypothetical protein
MGRGPKYLNHFNCGKATSGPEDLIVKALRDLLHCKGWYTIKTHGNIYQSGLPDIYATHSRYGMRWIEVKDPNRAGDVFTNAQHEVFPKITANGGSVWVLVAATEEEYAKLFERGNWYQYLNVFTRTKGLG